MPRKILSLYAFLLAVALLGAPGARAQDSPEYRDFRRIAGDQSALFRGRIAERHETITANGHPFWSTREFLSGDITVDGRTYCDVPINIDVLTQQALVRLSNGVFSIALEPAQVSSILLNGHRYVGVSGESDIPEGFYEVIGQGPEFVYKQISKTLASSTNNVNGEVLGYVDPNYNPKIMRYFAYSVRYYFRDREGRFFRFRDADGLIRHFRDKKKELRKAARKLEQDRKDFDLVCQVILNTAAL